MNIAAKLSQKTALKIIPGLMLLNLAAILIGVPRLDFYMRPLVLFSLLIFGVLFGETHRSGSWFLLAGLGMAVIVEALQKLEIMAEIMVVGTALYYTFYCIAFVRFPTFRFSRSTFGAWAFVGLYMVLMFSWLEPYALRLPAMVYMVVTTLMVGLALTPQLIGDSSLGARRQTIGVFFLLFSDTLRACAIFRFSQYKGEFWLEHGLETLIMVLFFAGQFFLVRSLVPRPAAHAEGGQ